MTIYFVNVRGINAETNSKVDVFLEAFDSDEKANNYIDKKNKEIDEIIEKMNRKETKCLECDHDPESRSPHCEYCEWSKLDYTIKITTSNREHQLLKCGPKVDQKPEFRITEINLL